MALTLANVRPTGATIASPTGSLLFDVTGTGSFDVSLVRLSDSVAVLSLRTQSGPLLDISAPSLITGPYRIDLLPFATGQVSSTPVTIPAYDFPAPTVDTSPPAQAAAHVPMPVVLRAEPSGTPLAPAALLLVVEVGGVGHWREVGRLREVCDATLGTAYFDLSEYLKTQFATTPPDESGDPDPALTVQYRVRYGRLPDFTGADGTEGGQFSGLAVNASEVVNPGGELLPLDIGPVTPYASVPPGYARFRTRLYGNAAGNRADVPAAAGDWPCPVRQFVWLTRRGAWSWGLFAGRHEHGTETADDTVVRRVSADYYAGGGDIRETLRVYSDKVDFATFLVLREIRRSRRVYERLASGLYLPVLIEKGSFPDYKETDKLFEVNFTVRYPVLTVQTF